MHPHETVYKRETYSGTTHRTNYGKRVTFGNSTHFSMKDVCYECAVFIDEKRKNQNNNFYILVGVGLVILFIYLIFK